jgi:hypothetical protein
MPKPGQQQRKKEGSERKPQDRSVLPLLSVSGYDEHMLAAAKQFLEQGRNVFKQAADHILVVTDERDAVGADGAAAAFGAAKVELSPESPRIGKHGKENPHPFTAFWVPRSKDLLAWLQGRPNGCPAGWVERLEMPPEHGAIYTILERSRRQHLLMIDYTTVSSLGAAPVKGSIGAKRNPNNEQ